MLIFVALACSIAMLRPAHSLDKLQASGNLGVLVDPTFSPTGGCPTQAPVDLEYRIGLGRGFELGARGLFPPRALSLKHSFLDERRQHTPISAALQVEAGAQLTSAGGAISLAPFLRADLLGSGTARLGPNVQLRPVLSAGWWAETRGSETLDQGPGWTAGLFVPVRIPGGFGLAPGIGASGWLPTLHAPEVYARIGLLIEPWLEPAGSVIPPER